MNVGEKVSYRCQKRSEVTDLGQVVQLECLDSGLLEPAPADQLACRAPVECEAPPAPAADSRLKLVTAVGSGAVLEWAGAKYECNEGSSLTASTDKVFPADSPMACVSDKYFHLECGRGGKYPTGHIPWPTCQATHCLEDQVQSIADFHHTAVPSSGVAVGAAVEYSCSNPNEIAGNSLAPVSVECTVNGTLAYPDPFPECRAKASCDSE